MAIPEQKNPEIRRFQSDLMGTDVTQSIRQDLCVSCKGPATEFKNDISRKEYGISGLCQTCQDEVFTPPEEDTTPERLLLSAFADLGLQDLYTDAHEYSHRVGAMRVLAALAGALLEGKPVPADVIQSAWDSQDGDEDNDEEDD